MRHNRHRKKARWHNASPKVLVLNKGYMPIDVKDWPEAIADWYSGRADIIDSYDEIILHSGNDKFGNMSTEMQCPSVIRMLDNISGDQGALVNVLPMSRKNILDRDHNECAFCGTKLTLATMTIDHVYPVSKCGLNDWANVRACCKSYSITRNSITNTGNKRKVIPYDHSIRRRSNISCSPKNSI